jgi:hypothetical protein
MAQPASFDEELMTDWSLWLLDHGLPELPERVELGQSVPVARWAGRRFGAVLHLQWNWSDDHEDDYLATEVELFCLTESGWEAASGGGGSNWPFEPPLTRPVVPAASAEFWGETGSGELGWSVVAFDGLSGTDATAVEVTDSDGVTRQSVDSPLGVVLAAFDATKPATVRVIAYDGRTLASRDHHPRERGRTDRDVGEHPEHAPPPC